MVLQSSTASRNTVPRPRTGSVKNTRRGLYAPSEYPARNRTPSSTEALTGSPPKSSPSRVAAGGLTCTQSGSLFISAPPPSPAHTLPGRLIHMPRSSSPVPRAAQRQFPARLIVDDARTCPNGEYCACSSRSRSPSYRSSAARTVERASNDSAAAAPPRTRQRAVKRSPRAAPHFLIDTAAQSLAMDRARRGTQSAPGDGGLCGCICSSSTGQRVSNDSAAAAAPPRTRQRAVKPSPRAAPLLLPHRHYHSL